MRMGIDLGGTKIEAIVLDDAGSVRFRERVPTPQGDYAGTLAAIGGLVARAERTVGAACTVGMGTPGTISPASGLMKNSNSTVLNGKPLKQDLEQLLGREIRMANDANCFALSEAVDGAAAGAEVVFGVIVGTGCGAGVVVGGHTLIGPNAIAGEWGHNPLPWPNDDERPGPACYCGKYGCIETWLSGTGFANLFAAETGERLQAPEIVARAEAGDAVCEAALQRYEDRMARSLAHVINILDPDVIVLGGGLSNVRRLYDNVPKLWGRYVFSDRVATRLVAPLHGDSSGVRGAAWLWSR
ncbi:MAG: ROK family protein [Gammaproteobacteria bacterium]|nr:ROK family protein [Gammaproteobacteria bacterium]